MNQEALIIRMCVPFAIIVEVSTWQTNIRGQGVHLCWWIWHRARLSKARTLSTSFLSSYVKFNSAVARKKFSANQRIWQPSLLADQPPKNKLGTGRWVLAPCKVSYVSRHDKTRLVEFYVIMRKTALKRRAFLRRFICFPRVLRLLYLSIFRLEKIYSIKYC